MSSLKASLFILLLMIGEGVFETVRCPRYCTCYMNITDYTRTVSCKGKRLDNIDLSVPKRVQTLDLSNNSISALDDRGFQNLGLIELVNLYLKHNSIRSVGLHSFTGLVYLKKVDLSGNNLYQFLPWTFHENNNLKFLSLSGNPLGHIIHSGPLLDIPSLEVLELSNCHFGFFSDDAFTTLPNLKRLDISQNQLISFDLYAIHFLHNLKELDISKNPWQCNTNMKNLKDFMDSKSGNLQGFTCDLPKKEEKPNQKKPVMFEKIIAVGNNYPEYENFENFGEDSTENEDGSSEEGETGDKNKCQCTSEEQEMDAPFVSLDKKTFTLSPSWLMFFSFQFGMFTAIFFPICCGKLWFCYKRKKHNQLGDFVPITPTLINADVQTPGHTIFVPEDDLSMQSSVETISCPDTPPPSYRQLFMT